MGFPCAWRWKLEQVDEEFIGVRRQLSGVLLGAAGRECGRKAGTRRDRTGFQGSSGIGQGRSPAVLSRDIGHLFAV